MRKSILLILISLIVLASSCKKEDDPDVPEESQGTMTVVMNGVTYEQTKFNNTLLSETQAGQKGKRLDLRTTLNGGTFVVTISNWDWQNPPKAGVLSKTYDIETEGYYTQCKDIGDINFCDGALGSYILNVMKQYMTYDAPYDSATGFIRIDKCDAANKKVSGAFDFVAEDLFEGDTIAFHGTFKDLVYRVIN